MLDSYTEKRRQTSPVPKSHPWASPALRILKMLLLHLAMAPGINTFLRLFNDNLYARERLAESKRGLEREVEDTLISLEMNIAEVEVPSQFCLCGQGPEGLEHPWHDWG